MDPGPSGRTPRKKLVKREILLKIWFFSNHAILSRIRPIHTIKSRTAYNFFANLLKIQIWSPLIRDFYRYFRFQKVQNGWIKHFRGRYALPNLGRNPKHPVRDINEAQFAQNADYSPSADVEKRKSARLTGPNPEANISEASLGPQFEDEDQLEAITVQEADVSENVVGTAENAGYIVVQEGGVVMEAAVSCGFLFYFHEVWFWCLCGDFFLSRVRIFSSKIIMYLIFRPIFSVIISI